MSDQAPPPAPGVHTLLVVDDVPDTLEVIRRNLEAAGYAVLTASAVEPAVALLESQPVDLVVTDYKMPKVSGLDLVRHVRSNHPDTEVMMITGFASVEGAVQAMKAGAEEYLPKPFTDEELLAAVKRSLAKLWTRRAAESSTVEEPLREFGLVGRSRAMRRLFAAMEKAASQPTTVLITGETGTGKELVARAFHHLTTRAASPFIAVRCGGIPESLLERALFGHVKGAFAGATETRAGFFQTAQGGSLFLNEISEVSTDLQVKLLRAMQENEVCMVGSTRPFAWDVCVIASTNNSLPELVRQGSFREDLFRRLAVVILDVPPLRERGDDVLGLAQFMADKHARLLNRRPPSFSPEAQAALRRYEWPGNVRELEGVVQHLVLQGEGEPVNVVDLPRHMRFDGERPSDGHKSLRDVELEHIQRVVASVGGNKSEAARILGISRKTLRERLRS